MQANDMLEYRDKITEAFRHSTFSSEHLKESDAAAYGYVLKDVNFIQKIKSMAKNINSSLFEDFLNHHHQLIMERSLSMLRIQMKTKKLQPR